MAGTSTQNKDADTTSAEPKEKTVTVYFLSHYNRGDGRTYGPGAVVSEVPISKANELRRRGVVRKASKEEVDNAFQPVDDSEEEPEVKPGTVKGEMGADAEKNRAKERDEDEPPEGKPQPKEADQPENGK